LRNPKIIFILTILILVLSFTVACRADDEPPPADPTPPPATPEIPPEPLKPETVTLRWAVGGRDAYLYYRPLIAAYKEIAPNVTIEIVDLGENDWNVVAQTHLVGKHEYDIINVYDIHGYMMHVNADLLYPLDDFAASRDITVSDYKSIPEQFTIDGSFYALPFFCEFWVVFYNMDLFDAAEIERPDNQMTFEAWVEKIKDVTQGRGDDKIRGNFFDPLRSTITLFGILDGIHTVNDGDYDFLLPYYEAILALEDGDYIPPIFGVEQDRSRSNPFWQSGRIAQMNTSTNNTAGSVRAGFNWGIASYPVPTSSDHGNAFGKATQLAIPRSAKHPEEAMDFIAFVCGAQGARIIASTGRIPAMMTDAALDRLIETGRFPGDEITRGALSPRKIFLEQPPGEFAEEIDLILTEVHLDIISREVSIEDGIALMNERVSAILR